MKTNNPIINILIVATAIIGPFAPAYFIVNDNIWAFIISYVLSISFILFVDIYNALSELADISWRKKKKEGCDMGFLERTIKIHEEAMRNSKSGTGGISGVFIFPKREFIGNEPELIRESGSELSYNLVEQRKHYKRFTEDMLQQQLNVAVKNEDYELAAYIKQVAKERGLKI